MPKDIPNPLLLVSSGRSGTTLMMGYLAAHPGIVANTDYPLETRVGQYYAHVANVLLDRAGGDTDQYFRTIVEGRPWATANPYQNNLGTTWIENEYKPRLVSLIKDTIRHVYLEESEKQGKTAGFFVEKTLVVSKARHALMAMFPGYREIYLVRDPRAVVLSILNFNKKRGSDGFGADKFKSPIEYIETYAKRLSNFRKLVEKEGEQCMLVRYEDLVTSPAETLTRIFCQLDIAVDEATLQDLISKSDDRSREYIGAHATTASAIDSITSWKNNLPGEFREAIEDRMQCLLDYFHYTNM